MPLHFWFNTPSLVCLHLCIFFISYGSITSDLCSLFQEHNQGVKQGLGVLHNRRYHETNRMCQDRYSYIHKGELLHLCIQISYSKEQKWEADMANNILHLSKTTVDTSRHMPHHKNTDYILTRVKLTVTDTGINYSFAHVTEWRLSVLRFKLSAIQSHRDC